jgi:hypothetical protein
MRESASVTVSSPGGSDNTMRPLVVFGEHRAKTHRLHLSSPVVGGRDEICLHGDNFFLELLEAFYLNVLRAIYLKSTKNSRVRGTD